jgi:hypothetical protein
VPTTIHVTTSLPTYVAKHSNHQPSDGRHFGNSLGGSSPKGDLLGEPPFNIFVASFGWPTLALRMFIPPWGQPPIVQPISKPTIKSSYMMLQYPTYVKDTDLNVHIKVFKKAIKTNGETMKVDIINLFSFTFRDNIFEWGENYIQDHPKCTFEELEHAFCKQFKIVKNNEEVYMQLQNIQQQTIESVKVYYEHLLKLANYLQVKVTNVFFTIVFKACLLPYVKLTTTGMKRNILIEHKEVVVVCEENGSISLNYNVLLTTPNVNSIVKHVVPIVITKSTITYTNCGKTGHSMESCHNRKREVLVVPTTIIKFIKPVIGTKTQLVKLGKILVHYPCIICSSINIDMENAP